MTKKNKVGGINLLGFKTYYMITLTEIAIAWCWQKDRHIHQQNRTENQEIDPHKHAKLVFGKSAKNQCSVVLTALVTRDC